VPASIVQCESGGNYSAVNPSSGAGGAYQILPSTWHAYGGQGLPQDASPAEQDRIAGEIYARQGGSAWTC
jgi:muramidase (phage lysozyme)